MKDLIKYRFTTSRDVNTVRVIFKYITPFKPNNFHPLTLPNMLHNMLLQNYVNLLLSYSSTKIKS